MSSSFRICVFCGARPGASASSIRLAQETGRIIAQRGYSLMYGGGFLGLMGELAHSALRHGAPVVGIVPRFLHEREPPAAHASHETTVTESIFERKSLMIDKADAFLALPGGYGTLDEVLEVISLRHLGVCTKPLVLLDNDGFWIEFTQMIETLRLRKFVVEEGRHAFDVAHSAEDAIDLLAPAAHAGDDNARPAG